MLAKSFEEWWTEFCLRGGEKFVAKPDAQTIWDAAQFYREPDGKLQQPLVTLRDQIASVRREIRMREGAYPRWVEAGKMTQQRANEEMRAMKAVEITLSNLMIKQVAIEEPELFR